MKRYLAYFLDLPVNEAKSGIRRPVKFEVLGFGFVPRYEKGKRGVYQLVANKTSWQRFRSKLKQVTRKTLPYSFDERIQQLKEVYRGWINYYRKANIYTKLRKMDEWLRNRIRYCIWKDWKRPERRRKNLIRLGISQGQAYAWSRTGMGGWAVAQSPIMRTTITTARLKKRGYASMADYYLKLNV